VTQLTMPIAGDIYGDHWLLWIDFFRKLVVRHHIPLGTIDTPTAKWIGQRR